MTIWIFLIGLGIIAAFFYIFVAFCFWLWGLGMGSYETLKDKLLSPFTSLLWLPVMLWPKKFDRFDI